MAAAAARTQAYIVAAKRTPFGAFGGKLKDLKASELGGLAGKAALATLPKETKVDSVIFGSVSQTDNSGAYVARHVGHYSGLPVTVPALTVNRLCGSGFQSVVNANLGGTENMSLSPYTLHGVRFGNTRYGVDQKLVDSLAAALIDQVPGGHPGAAPTPMGVTAENLAQKYGITREQCDAYALRSQQRWAAAQEAGAFNDEISPVELKGKKGTEVFSVDEHPRPTATPEALAKLPSVFIKQTGTVSAGNASGIGDGAAANVVASEAACQQYNLPKLARIVSYGISACEPSIMGIGPVEAIKIALSRAGLKKDDIDLWDVNEAFAAQWLAVQKELELPDEISNVFGGAIALAHPLGASGARITANLVHNLRRLNKRYGVGAACIGGGQGIALVLEKA
ncbi:acetyl-CoA C-acetyltransferase [Rhizoctonia solani]|uniref:Acetyl-CoA C-acetyltransferase n=1 Tax=Rhizoctonia solani TaxID=456999 RepID=A0A8H8P0E2_9AGAM|nr:acetyl-CoA C-acetyltransferase [Rhizoctonia solani]QRW22050.1 acetyl-CoA C-acetyltransferase [Rhizoctonia solani]